MNDLMIGLFGTCGDSIWRNEFIETYKKLNINYFNPQVKDCKPAFTKIEAEHLINDKIILFRISSETYGIRSLSEVGFSILHAIILNNRRNFVILIDDYLDDNLNDEKLAEESLRTRTIVIEHLKKLNLPNIYIAKTLKEMLDISLILYNSEKMKLDIEKYSISTKS